MATQVVGSERSGEAVRLGPLLMSTFLLMVQLQFCCFLKALLDRQGLLPMFTEKGARQREVV